ncbi:histidinol-phosphatase [Plebeiibacterium sediminum]|uniref:Histidinol-phosphatase n=1 Tax=Plebeiibacterium sediminum TaxID=2992112 RepID=A0AAE3M526_9BACT|nr:histidinol-phosphatase [Plebeiobacterium sediminum]MCW3787029.1 histidinol-phosphatase [Plebeiobacterium sediminum]
MSWTNYHGHCNYCDGHGKIEDYIVKAIEYNMPVIGISSHAPVPFDCFWTMKEDQLQNYDNEVMQLQEKYKHKITVLKSLEIDYLPGYGGFNKAVLDHIDLDYRIGSIHFIDRFKNGNSWGIDGSFDEFKEGLREIFNNDIQLAVKRFYELTRGLIKNQQFEILGHFDKIKMHNVVEPLFDESEDWYIKEVESVLSLVAEKGIIVEINTKSYEKNGLLFPGPEIFPLLKKYNIPVTINSDAHIPEKLQSSYTEVALMLIEAGFTTLREYKDGVWCDVAFNKDGLQWID